MTTLCTKSPKWGFTAFYYADDEYIGRHLPYDGVEPVESRLFMRVLRPDSQVLDLGANLGYYSLLASKVLDPTRGRVLAVEPESENYDLLCRNLEVNGIQCVQPLRLAAGSASAIVKLYKCKANRGDHRLWSGGGEDSEDVCVVTVDSLCRYHDFHPSIVKMDCQGWEPFIVAGMSELLEQSDVPLLMFAEFTPAAYPLLGVDGRQFFSDLNSLFTLYIIDDYSQRTLPVSRYEEIVEYVERVKHTHANLFCVRGHKYPKEGFCI